jgi:hypothetical protein
MKTINLLDNITIQVRNLGSDQIGREVLAYQVSTTPGLYTPMIVDEEGDNRIKDPKYPLSDWNQLEEAGYLEFISESADHSRNYRIAKTI